MSQILLDVALLDLTIRVKRRSLQIVSCADALALANLENSFDLVIGNPPYGKVTLQESQRKAYQSSLFGHANLYGLFTHLAVRISKTTGLVAYVTPTSFLGGEYFKNLRKLLVEKAPLRRIDFLSDREGVFEGVLQETALAVFEKSPKKHEVCVQLLQTNSEELKVSNAGEVEISAVKNGGPWFLPRNKAQVKLIRTIAQMSNRLIDYKFVVATGQLVWNRHKDQLRAHESANCYPIVWAEAIGPTGEFRFQFERQTHLPYLKVRDGQEFLINYEPCVLVQRTTAKEQSRRLFAAVIPNDFVLGGYLVENHLNMILPIAKNRVLLRTVATLLNSQALDQVFRCINGSVAVSAYELTLFHSQIPIKCKPFSD